MREKVLIPAFVRALKDPFPPGRSAALLSLTATQQYHSAADVASKVIPYIAPVALDPEASVRETALQSLRVYVGKLETASRNIGKPRDPNAAPGTGGAAAEDSALPPEVSEAASKVLSSMSWITGSSIGRRKGRRAHQQQGDAAAPAAAGGGGGGGGAGGAGGGGGGGAAPSMGNGVMPTTTRVRSAQTRGGVSSMPAPAAAPAAGCRRRAADRRRLGRRRSRPR